MSMKKMLALLLALVMMVCTFAGCSKAAMEAGKTAASATYEPEGDSQTASVANPMRESDPEEIKDLFGATFTEPEGASDVKYFIYNEELAEMQFVLSETGTECCARISPAEDFTDNSGAYYSWDITDNSTVMSNFMTEDRYADTAEDGCVELFLWFDRMDQTMYSLLVKDKNLDGFDITAVAIQLMGDDYVNFAADYTGFYEDGDFDTVDAAGNGDGTYSVEVSITRLCTLNGTGLDVDGAMEFTAEAPDGKSTINGVFYPDGDTYTLMITKSEWELLAQGSLFEGFVLK